MARRSSPTLAVKLHRMPTVLSNSEIKTFLETAALYSWREFARPAVNRGSLWIPEIDSYCEVCEQPRPFQDLSSRGGGSGMSLEALKSGTSYFTFKCVSCRKAEREFLVEQIVDDKSIKLQKYGELPRKQLPRDPTLQKFFSDDLANYEKAVICLANEYGVAAFAYLRRITEANIVGLIDLLEEDVRSSGGDLAITAALAELRKESPMSEKIRVANLALPPHLKPDGLNPLGRLYQVLSEGVHSLSDAECLERARTICECLAFLVSELASRKQHRARFKSVVGRL